MKTSLLFKQLSLALVALGLSGTAFASVSIPDQGEKFTASITGIYWAPNAGNDTYATSVVLTPSGRVSTNEAINPDFSPGFIVNLGTGFAGTGNDANISWTHLRTSDRDTFTSTGTLVPMQTSPFGADGFTSSTANSLTALDAVNVNVGQHILFGNNFDLRLFTGIDWARVKNTTTQTFIEPPIIYFNTDSSRFNGIGPEIGANANYNFGHSGFGAEMNLNTAMLVGNTNSNNTASETLGAVQETAVISQTATAQVVPFVDVSLAASYSHALPKTRNATATALLGYDVNTYFGAQRTLSFSGSITTSNISFAGPFLTLEITA